MAEFVQQSIEEMLPELEQMERVGLFTAHETRAILQKRKAYEYKLRRRTKEKEDFLQYVQYELNVLALLRKRREKIGYKFKRAEIDVAIVQRVHKLFRLACVRFKDDVKLWLSHIEFAKKRGEKSTVSRLLTQMLAVHNRKPDLWIMAAKWEMEDNVSMDNARSLLQRALRNNPASHKLWHEYFRMELLNAEKLQKRREVLGLAGITEDEEMASDAVLEGRVAEIVFRRAAEAHPDDVSFLLGFASICGPFGFTHKFQDTIYSQLQQTHGESEELWNALARRNLQVPAKGGSKLSAQERENIAEKGDEECWRIFEEAVSKINTECMWTFFLKACLELINLKASKRMKRKRIEKTLHVFQNAQKNKCVSDQMFQEWITVLEKTGQVETYVKVCQMATAAYPQSVPLWCLHLTSQIQYGDQKSVCDVIDAALSNNTEEDSLQLWRLSLEWSVINKPGFTQTLLERGVSSENTIVCATLKEQYLDWAALNTDIKTVRQLYKRLRGSKPLTVGFFLHYISIEKSQAKVKIEKVRRVYEDAIREYGKTDIDLWLKYIALELSPNGRAENAGQIHWRAVKTLDSGLTDAFIAQYTLQQTGHLPS